MILSPDPRLAALKDAEEMHAFRIFKKKYSNDPLFVPLQGHRANRWNLDGTPMIYLGSTPSIAALEMQGAVSNFGPYGLFSMIGISIPTHCIEILPHEDYPTDWANNSHPISTQILGSTWQREGRSFALLIRSARSPQEYNLLVNPHHPDRKHLVIGEIIDHPLSYLESKKP